MDPKFMIFIKILTFVNSAIVDSDYNNNNETSIDRNNTNLDDIFNGVYTECFMHLSYMCLQRKTLLYLKELNNLNEVSVFGDYVKFVKLNTTIDEDKASNTVNNNEELAFMIDKAIDSFFDNHVLKFNALGKDIVIPRNVGEFVGRKKRKGGGGGGHMMDDGGKKKMMMMAMMCMKMKLMMMVPAMMGMMGMMSFKGMMFSMMSFMISKMMLLMKLLEKKGAGGLGGGGGGGGDGGWMAASGGGGAWMPAGGQDYGGGGGYDANGQWQSRSIVDNNSNTENKPTISYVKPVVSYSNQESMNYKIPVLVYKKSNVNFDFGKEGNTIDHEERNSIDNIIRVKRDLSNDVAANIMVMNRMRDDDYSESVNDISSSRDKRDFRQYSTKETRPENQKYAGHNTGNDKMHIENSLVSQTHKSSRPKRSILDLLQNSYLYWMNKLLGLSNNRRTAFQRYKIINGVKYVYYPYPFRVQKPKMPKELNPSNDVKTIDKPVIAPEDFNKGEIMEGGIQSRMMKKKFNKMKNTVDEAVEDNPWE